MEVIPTILAPTASGKTNLAVHLAKKIDGEVIGLDSRQIYDQISIGTAQPTPQEMQCVVHHLIGNKPLDEPISAGQYAKLVLDCIDKIKSKQKIPIVCGGAGLYYRALYSGIFDQSKSELTVRKKLENMYDSGNAQKMMMNLKKIDPDYSEHIHINNRKRLIRALEIYESTGKAPSEHFNDQRSRPHPNINLYSIYLNWDRTILRKRISRRTSKMIKKGWIAEVKNLISIYPDFDLQPLDSIGFKQIVSYLNEQIKLEDLEMEINTKTYQYAVKQIKWFKKEKIDLIIDMDSKINIDQVTKKVLSAII